MSERQSYFIGQYQACSTRPLFDREREIRATQISF